MAKKIPAVMSLCLAVSAGTLAAGPPCATCREHHVAPSVAAGDAGQAGAYHPNTDEFAYYDPSPDGPHPGSGQLLVFMPGSPLAPSQYQDFLRLAARLGYHAVAIGYWNSVELKKLCLGHPACFGAVRHQLFDATREAPWTIHERLQAIGASAPSFSARDSVKTRLVALLHWLVHQHGDEHWGQFLVDPGCARDECQVRWGKVVLAGHSMGAGEAAYLATQRDVPRVVMLSGPVDDDADWTKDPRAHPERYFGLAHVCDRLFYAPEMQNWAQFGVPGARTFIEAGLASPAPDAPRASCASPPAKEASARPYGHSQQLIMAFDDGCASWSGNVRWHNQVAMDCDAQPSVLLEAWRYLLGAP